MRNAFVLVLLPALYATSVMAQSERGSAEHVAAVFCDNHGDINMGTRAPYLSPGLIESIAAAEAANQRFVEDNPDEKPPLGDGIPWQSAPDYAEKCKPGEPHYMMDVARLTVSYEFPDYPDAGYEDRLWLVLVDGHWLIDDISYASGGLSLRDVLDFIATGASE
jgi:hypothetical protein